MKKILSERQDIAFYFKIYPLQNQPPAIEKSKAILCEKSLSLLEDAFEKKALPKAVCETNAADENKKLAQRLGLTSVPTSILPDGRVIRGYLEAKEFLQKIGP